MGIRHVIAGRHVAMDIGRPDEAGSILRMGIGSAKGDAHDRDGA